MTLFSCTGLYANSAAAYLMINATKLDTIQDARDLSVYVKFLV
jgi:hypothetical protein